MYLSVAPTAFAHIGWKFYIFFIVITSISIFVLWYFFPEVSSRSSPNSPLSQDILLIRFQTEGKSLEEITAIFGDTVEHEPLNDAKLDFATGADELHPDEKGRVAHIEAEE